MHGVGTHTRFGIPTRYHDHGSLLPVYLLTPDFGHDGGPGDHIGDGPEGSGAGNRGKLPTIAASTTLAPASLAAVSTASMLRMPASPTISRVLSSSGTARS